MDLLGMMASALGFDAAGGDTRDPEFDDWYRGHGYQMFGGDRTKARQWYDQRRAVPQENRLNKAGVSPLMPGALV